MNAHTQQEVHKEKRAELLLIVSNQYKFNREYYEAKLQYHLVQDNLYKRILVNLPDEFMEGLSFSFGDSFQADCSTVEQARRFREWLSDLLKIEEWNKTFNAFAGKDETGPDWFWETRLPITERIQFMVRISPAPPNPECKPVKQEVYHATTKRWTCSIEQNGGQQV